MVKKKSYDLFLSHAAADKPLVEAFETLLCKSLGITSSAIFCSSLEGQGVPKGGNFVDEIRAKAESAKAVVALITPSYLDSPFCMAELGAAWVLKTRRISIVVPPNTFKVMEATLLSIVGVKIDNADALAQAFEELGESVGTTPTIAVRSRAMREFQRAWAELKDDVPPPSRIEASIHAAMVQERDEAVEARDAAEEELSKAEAKIAALRQAKDAAAVAEIDRALDDSDWQEQFDDALDKIRGLYPEVGGKEIVRLIIRDYLGKFFRPDADSYPEETGRAIELDVYDDENYKWNYGHPDVAKLIEIIKEIEKIFWGYPEASEYLKSQKLRHDPENIRFWEENLR